MTFNINTELRKMEIVTVDLTEVIEISVDDECYWNGDAYINDQVLHLEGSSKYSGYRSMIVDEIGKITGINIGDWENCDDLDDHIWLGSYYEINLTTKTIEEISRDPSADQINQFLKSIDATVEWENDNPSIKILNFRIIRKAFGSTGNT